MHIGRRSMAASFLAALTGCVALAGVSSAPAGAQVYPPNRCSLALSVSAAIPGQTIIAGSANCSPGFAAGARVEITLESDPVYLGTVTAPAGWRIAGAKGLDVLDPHRAVVKISQIEREEVQARLVRE